MLKALQSDNYLSLYINNLDKVVKLLSKKDVYSEVSDLIGRLHKGIAKYKQEIMVNISELDQTHMEAAEMSRRE